MIFPQTEEQKTRREIGEEIFASIVANARGIGIHEKYPYIEAAFEMQRRIPRDMICFGAADEEFSTEPVCIPRTLSTRALVLGSSGTGKTSWVKSICIDQMHGMFGDYLGIIDPKGEYYTTVRPQKNERLIPLLKKFGLAPRGYPIKYLTPKFLGGLGEVGEEFTFDFADFACMENQPEIIKAAEALLNIEGMAYKSAQRQLIKFFPDAERMPKRATDLQRSVLQLKQQQEHGKFYVRTSSLLSDWIEVYLNAGYIGSNHRVDIGRAMHDYGIVILRTLLGGSDEIAINTYTKLFLHSLIYERRKFTRDQRPDGLMRPLCLLIDEADVHCPREKTDKEVPTRATIVNCFTKYRADGISCWLVTQHPEKLADIPKFGCNYIIFSRVRSAGERQLLLSKGIHPNLIDMEFSQMSKMEHGYVDENGEWGIFYPLPCRSEIFEAVG